MSEFKIEKGIPISSAGGHRAKKYPFLEMTVGDSVFIHAKITDLSGSVWWAQHKLGGKFSKRSVTENGVKGVRVWRIE